MAELSQSARNWLEDLANQPAARQPATLGEIWDSEWKRSGLDTITGVGRPLAEARTNLATAIETAAGKPIADYAAEKRIKLGAGVTTDQNIAALNALADTLPQDQQERLRDLRDVRARAVQSAQKTEKDAAEVYSATYGLAGTATAWAAGIARQTSDPINLALMAATAPIGGPITGGAAKFIAGQAVAGAVSQAAVEPYIQPSRAELGLESGIGRAAGNILEAGIGGAVIGGGFVGLHRLFGAAARSYRSARAPAESVDAVSTAEAPIQPAPVAAAGESPVAGDQHPNLTPEDFDALTLHAERDAVVNEPARLDADPVAHAEMLTEATRAVEEGRPLLVGERLETPPPERVVAPAEPELPLAKPIEPKGPPTELKEPVEVVGDPVLAQDADRRIAQRPEGDLQVHIEQADGTIKAGSAKAFLKEIADDAKALNELVDCIGQEPK